MKAPLQFLKEVAVGVVVQALLAGAIVLVVYGKYEEKIKVYDQAIVENDKSHVNFAAELKQIDREGPSKSAPFYLAVNDLTARMSVQERNSDRMDERVKWIMTSLEQLQRAQGLQPPPKPSS